MISVLNQSNILLIEGFLDRLGISYRWFANIKGKIVMAHSILDYFVAGAETIATYKFMAEGIDSKNNLVIDYEDKYGINFELIVYTSNSDDKLILADALVESLYCERA